MSGQLSNDEDQIDRISGKAECKPAQQLGEMFEGDFADTCINKFPLMTIENNCVESRETLGARSSFSVLSETIAIEIDHNK